MNLKDIWKKWYDRNFLYFFGILGVLLFGIISTTVIYVTEFYIPRKKFQDLEIHDVVEYNILVPHKNEYVSYVNFSRLGEFKCPVDFDDFQKGDSVSKMKGETILKVFRKNKLIFSSK